MKPIQFMGRSLRTIRDFPDDARRETGHQLDRLQHGLDPGDWKPMPSVGEGVREIRIRARGQFRVIYIATLPHHIVMLHAFVKKTHKTARRDLDASRRALRNLKSE